MAIMAFDIASLLGGSLGQTLADIIGKFKADPNKVIEMQEMVSQNQSLIDQKQLDLQGKLQDAMASEVQAASANIRSEQTSGDKYTSRARPTFLYFMMAVFGANYILFPLIGKTPLTYPDALFWLFGSGYLGYTGARSWDKFMGLPGESQLSLGSFKVGNTPPKGN